jgi:hypothetical protein
MQTAMVPVHAAAAGLSTAHRWGGMHERAHPPQLLFVSSEVSQPFARFPSQFPKPAAHRSWHVPLMHNAAELGPAGQTLPHAPQFRTLDEIAVSQPFNGSPSQLPKPPLHASEHVPPTHRAVPFAPPGHATPQRPQCAGFIVSAVSQPLASIVSQLPKPRLHVEPQALAVQVGLALGRAGQVIPQPPQLAGSVAGVTQLAPQSICVAPHVDTHMPTIGSHTVPAAHGRPQAPQFAGLLRAASQPFDAFMSQSAKPGRHVNPHAPRSHVGVAFGRGGHAFPQAPQLRASLSSTASHPFAAIASQSPAPARHT